MKEDRASDVALQFGSTSTRSTFFSPDGSLIKAGVGEIRGPEAIQADFDQGLRSGSSVGLTWAAERAEVSNSGDLGYTVGYYQVDSVGEDGVRSRVRGMYVNIWRRQPDESWKIELSIRNPTTTPVVVSEGDSG
jgi:ketosteroid isomerase-like protein